MKTVPFYYRSHDEHGEEATVRRGQGSSKESRMKPDSTTSVGKFERITHRVLTAACAIALTAGLAGCGTSTAGM